MDYFSYCCNFLFIFLNLSPELFRMICANNANEETLKEFFRHFFSPGYKFDTVYALSLLTVGNRSTVCQEFSDKYSSNNMIFLTHLDLFDNVTEQRVILSHIPVFSCISSDSSTNFHVTYTTNNKFFKLEKVAHPNLSLSESYEQLVSVSQSKIITAFSGLLHDISQKVVDYLSSKDYEQTAETTMWEYDKKWEELCKLFRNNYEKPKGKESYTIVRDRKVVIHHATFHKVPLLACPLNEQRNFYVGFYKGNIYFAFNDDYSFKYDLAMYLRKNSLPFYKSMGFK